MASFYREASINGQPECTTTRSRVDDWNLMIDELDEDAALSVSDDSLIAMGYEDGDDDEVPAIEMLPDEDLFVEFAASGNIDGLRLKYFVF